GRRVNFSFSYASRWTTSGHGISARAIVLNAITMPLTVDECSHAPVARLGFTGRRAVATTLIAEVTNRRKAIRLAHRLKLRWEVVSIRTRKVVASTRIPLIFEACE